METNHSELLATYLEILETQISAELSDPKTARGTRGKPIPGVSGANTRQLDLMDALKGIEAIREELAQENPDAARLAMLMSAVELNRLRLPVDSERQRYQGSGKGAVARKRKRTEDATRRYKTIRREAAKLKKRNPHISSTADKARSLARKLKVSERTIRRALATKTKNARTSKRI